ncbi:hypothetical protein RUM44_006496 [Polyplax serrata]|uniref:Ig-like domain-containing protein n=1 Tax=Polyplax serrata TaxID=468196 RepID=A0ABR1AIA0_POLSC
MLKRHGTREGMTTEETGEECAEKEDLSPQLMYKFIEQTMQPGPSVSLKCIAAGNPTPHFTWTLDGFALPHNDRSLARSQAKVFHLRKTKDQQQQPGSIGEKIIHKSSDLFVLSSRPTAEIDKLKGSRAVVKIFFHTKLSRFAFDVRGEGRHSLKFRKRQRGPTGAALERASASARK